MFNYSNRTTDSIIKPLMKIIKDLEAHIISQRDTVLKQDEEIKSISASRLTRLSDIAAANKVMSNVKSIVGM